MVLDGVRFSISPTVNLHKQMNNILDNNQREDISSLVYIEGNNQYWKEVPQVVFRQNEDSSSWSSIQPNSVEQALELIEALT